jgi:hypothetical protein
MRRYVLGALTSCLVLVFALAGAAIAGGGSEEAPAASESAARVIPGLSSTRDCSG